MYLGLSLKSFPHRQWVIYDLFGEILQLPKEDRSSRYRIFNMSLIPTIYIFMDLSSLIGVSKEKGLKVKKLLSTAILGGINSPLLIQCSIQRVLMGINSTFPAWWASSSRILGFPSESAKITKTVLLVGGKTSKGFPPFSNIFWTIFFMNNSSFLCFLSR